VTSGSPRYSSPAALRTALEEHLRQRANSTGTPLDRLRKEVAHQRLLARLAVVAPAGSWALKGGQALLARLDTQARATKDADATWRAALERFDDVLEAAVDTDLGDDFRFEVAAPRPMTAETDEGGLRYPVLALLDGREFERIQLDVNAVPDDQRPVDSVALRDLLGFAGIAPPQVPVIPVGQHLAEKLHAYTRDYGSQSNSRPRDLYDMLVIARSLPVPVSNELRGACRATFALRHTAWPPALPAPPTSWAATWESYVGDHDISWSDLDAASEALASFWLPMLIGTDDEADDAVWDPAAWAWSAAG
jgi:predicted nucleotidyltransferase component of viral defense system